jgi:hypothetical protein
VSRVEADEHGRPLADRREGVRYQLAVVFQGGWRIVSASPEERAVLNAHEFGSGRLH